MVSTLIVNNNSGDKVILCQLYISQFNSQFLKICDLLEVFSCTSLRRNQLSFPDFILKSIRQKLIPHQQHLYHCHALSVKCFLCVVFFATSFYFFFATQIKCYKTAVIFNILSYNINCHIIGNLILTFLLIYVILHQN